MRIKTLASIQTKNRKIEIRPEKFRLFKPDKLPTVFVLSNVLSIEVEIVDGQMSFDEFMDEIGHVVDTQALMELGGWLAAYDYLMSSEIEYAPKRQFKDDSPEAQLTRSVLSEAANQGIPQCSREMFRSLAFDKHIELGFSRAVLEKAIRLYA